MDLHFKIRQTLVFGCLTQISGHLPSGERGGRERKHIMVTMVCIITGNSASMVPEHLLFRMRGRSSYWKTVRELVEGWLETELQ